MKTSAAKFVRYWLPAIAWMLLILFASTDLLSVERTSRFIAPLLRWLNPDISGATIAAVQLLVRKAAHVTEYGILAALLWRALAHASAKTSSRAPLIAFLAAVAYAVLDEFHQSFTTSRTGSPVDVIIDATGALAGLALYWMMKIRKRVAAASTS
ncbi:MAG: VanZ family protein [Chthoniobacterales bacterium]